MTLDPSMSRAVNSVEEHVYESSDHLTSSESVTVSLVC